MLISRPRSGAASLWAHAASALLVYACAACGSSSDANKSQLLAPTNGAVGVSSQTDAERFFPLVDGTLFHYETTNESGEKGILIARVHRTDQTRGELVFPTGKKRFVYTSAGVTLDPSGDFVLAAPIAVGTTFRGQNGGRAVIEDVAVVIDVKAGSYRDCVRVVEERGGDRRARYTTTFCPNVGIVAIEAEAGTSFERAELVSAGPPIDLEKGGEKALPGALPPDPTPPDQQPPQPQ
ncbi:MAG: hypothetical protein IPK82_18080 [Polyangiaceae bacterium]|nr:hypothetical protein [Polyangiaceae bacterium]